MAPHRIEEMPSGDAANVTRLAAVSDRHRRAQARAAVDEALAALERIGGEFQLAFVSRLAASYRGDLAFILRDDAPAPEFARNLEILGGELRQLGACVTAYARAS